MPVFAVTYRYADDSAALRDEHRPAHRSWLREGDHGAVRVLASGPWADGDPGALIVVSGPDRSTVEADFDHDPFHTLGTIADRQVREWTQAIGPWA